MKQRRKPPLNTALTACLIAASLAAAATRSAAQTPDYSYLDESCNANGYVLSPGPDAAETHPRALLTTGKTYLGKTCDAFNRDLGKGAWCWANGGLNVELGGVAYGLARYELFCAHPALDPGACGCGAHPLPAWDQ
ncbi:MAG: hypothetical protein AAF503_12080 [Pseudomonadota bacterium]